MYLTKAIIELIVLATAYFIVSGMDKRITVLEKNMEINESHINRLYEKFGTVEKPFAEKVTREKKRIKLLKEQNMPKFATITYTGEIKEIKKSKKSK